ncbi:MAG: type I DNA topoisomerase [Flavobacteriaceae bacterium]
MAKNLVIVESPAKAKTIEKFLGTGYKVASSFGHIADLPARELGVDIEKNFMPKYEVSADKKKVVSQLKKLAQNAEIVWLASDEDREGEAIAWHLAQNLKLKPEKTKRIVFHEITKNAILKAIDNPREIDYNLVNAQQARRVLDRLVGYELSPVLWRKVKPGLSAGRVQSVAVRLIVERERDIKDFHPTQTFKTQATFLNDQQKSIAGVLNHEFTEVEEAEAFLKLNSESQFSLKALEKKPAKKSPTPPFTTSTLQQEAARKLYFSVSKTMTLAQRLYESGLITYMRTDSVNLSKEAQGAILNQIENRFGAEYVQARNFKTKNKGAQEAHEAIRPTDPSKIQVNLDYDQARLYELIWKRTVASQMSEARLERTKLQIAADNHPHLFIARGEVVTFDGFLKLYLEGKDEEEDATVGIIPRVVEGEALALDALTSTQRFSRPPARFSEAALVKKLEELGIGRPSTYAPTISTVLNRGYIQKGENEGVPRAYIQLRLQESVQKEIKEEKVGSDKGKLIPTDIGMIVNDFLVGNFKNVLDFNFTAGVEENFDEIARGNKQWTDIISGFYDDFHGTVNHVQEHAQRESGERILGTDPATGKVVKVRLGKFGPLAQLGENDEDEKAVFASLAPGQQLDRITFEEALELFQLPKSLGSYEDQDVQVAVGRYGPYVKFDGKFISLNKDQNPMEVTLDEAIGLIEAKRKADAPIHTYQNLPVTKGVGRFGPYLKWSNLFINVNKKYDFDHLSIEDIETLIADKIQKEKEKVIQDWTAEGIRIEKARWGRSNIIQGKLKIELSKDIDPTKITLEKAKEYISAKQPKKKKKTSKSVRK